MVQPPRKSTITPADDMEGKTRFELLWNRAVSGAGVSAPTVFSRLARLYGESHRHYHTLDHIRRCLEELDRAIEVADNPDAVEMALWFHDAIYVSGAKDNEWRSAELFWNWSEGCADLAFRERVRDLIMATTHRGIPNLPDACLIVDIDLCSFGQAWDEFEQDGRQIRAEYVDISDEDYFSGLLQFLLSLFNRSSFFFTHNFQQRYERVARANTWRLIESLQSCGYGVVDTPNSKREEARDMIRELGNLASILDSQPSSRQQISATVLFADICGSTQLFEKHGDWQARQIESRVLDLLSAKTNEFGGTVVKTIGDEIMSRFPVTEQAVKAACEMQEAIKNDPSLLELGISIKVGVHHGPVLIEQNDLFGDAVNIAARMVSHAKADQIITTRETVRFLPDKLEQMTRNLGLSWVRGKQDEMEIFEVIWQQETTGLTQLVNAGQQKELRNLLFARLILEYRGDRIELEPSAQTFTIGRGRKNRLIVDRELVSRSHADIEFRQGKFVLVDHSTNGTYLLLSNGSRFFVRREEFTLHDQGSISLGQAVTDDNTDLLRYQCVYA